MSGTSRNVVRASDHIVETRDGPPERQVVSRVNMSLLERIRMTRDYASSVLADARRLGLFEAEVSGLAGATARDLAGARR